MPTEKETEVRDAKMTNGGDAQQRGSVCIKPKSTARSRQHRGSGDRTKGTFNSQGSTCIRNHLPDPNQHCGNNGDTARLLLLKDLEHTSNQFSIPGSKQLRRSDCDKSFRSAGAIQLTP
ncbi:hypothetical protein XPA_005452 [Xanthoria parietina]